ncbi:MAG: bifunctional [glutamate--ammonia ligase]-adenylyl-L-tyrosine phosphorylase/[glutamate--ammonia-ligase] adenylyltransferase [Gammaproteobacteria bacterium]|nr:bifunctional [glutamate--ammonia ligase]-adenylyl-L-tyrosine phosphorylase/[glutamate--ammonia-ligase] adenylyltransferase [Gammaproteobacteria bacterium]
MTDIGDDSLRKEAGALPDILRAPFCLWLDRLHECGHSIPRDILANDQVRAQLSKLIGCSEFAAAILLREWPWFSTAVRSGDLEYPAFDTASPDFDSDQSFGVWVRRQRNRGLIRILWGIVAGDDIWKTLQLLSALADALIAASAREAEQDLRPVLGRPLTTDGEPIPFIIVAMGKLGGGELNFSSDIDLVFLYGGDGETDGPRTLSAHEYFTRLSQRVVRYLDEVTEDGFVYRVDTRLRPFGESGPPVLSLGALENYLLQHGRSWERYAYVKARVVGDAAYTPAAKELNSTVVEPFVYRQYLDYGVFESLRDMKALIEREVRKRELAANIKLGPGGIREIEFIVQSLQLVRGGANRDLRCRDLRSALERLGTDRGIGRDARQELLAAYEFLRRFENGIQAIRDQQTHEIPEDPADRARLSLMMGYDAWDLLAEELASHRARVSAHFAAVAFRGADEPASDQLETVIASLWRPATSVAEWRAWLESEAFSQADRIAVAVHDFANAPIQRQIDVPAKKRLDRFMQTLFRLLRKRRQPGIAVERVLAVVSQIARRSAYIALLNENPVVLERLIDLCEQSAYLAAEIQKFPALLDELLDPRLYSESISAAGMRDDLAERQRPLDTADSEAAIESLAQFQRATLFRIAVADVSQNLPIMKVSDRLTELAEIVLTSALDIAWRDLVVKHGEPVSGIGEERRKAGFGVVAYGKLGGMELSYKSDLDLVFLHDSVGADPMTDGERSIDNGLFFGRLVRRLVHFLTTQTSSGALYEVDTRLRPSGRSGLLVVSTDGFAKYQEDNAWTWEHQALLRSRTVAGSPSIARAFESIRIDTLRNRVRRDRLLDDVLSMRKKMRASLDNSSADRFDLKQGEGGIGDIEFLVQYLVLKYADKEPALVFYSDNIRQLGVLEAVGILPDADAARLQEIYRAYRLRSHRLALDDEAAVVNADQFEEERRFVRDVWQRTMQ